MEKSIFICDKLSLCLLEAFKFSFHQFEIQFFHYFLAVNGFYVVLA